MRGPLEQFPSFPRAVAPWPFGGPSMEGNPAPSARSPAASSCWELRSWRPPTPPPGSWRSWGAAGSSPPRDGPSSPSRPNLRVKVNESGRPAILARRIWYGWGFFDREAAEGYRAWVRRNRMASAVRLRTGHSWEALIARHRKAFEEHSEYLTLVRNEKDGTKRRQGEKLCLSNPAVRLEKDPAADMVSVGPYDGGGHCPCGPCLAMGASPTASSGWPTRLPAPGLFAVELQDHGVGWSLTLEAGRPAAIPLRREGEYRRLEHMSPMFFTSRGGRGRFSISGAGGYTGFMAPTAGLPGAWRRAGFSWNYPCRREGTERSGSSSNLPGDTSGFSMSRTSCRPLGEPSWYPGRWRSGTA